VPAAQRSEADGVPHCANATRHFKYTHSFGALDACEDITRKKREIERYLRAVAPFSLRPVEGQVVLDSSLSHVLLDTFFVARRRVNREPPSCAMRFGCVTDQWFIRFDKRNSVIKTGQGFAILAWVGNPFPFHRSS